MMSVKQLIVILIVFGLFLPITMTTSIGSTKQGYALSRSIHNKYEYDAMGNIFFDEYALEVQTTQCTSNSIGLPDLKFSELCCWWGPVNTSSIGLFVRYAVKNIADTYEGTEKIQSNLTFYADDNSSSFGYIIQTPFFYPTTWYTGEILSGNFYFEMDERPSTITVRIDSNNSIPEYNETNNKKSIAVVHGITVTGSLYTYSDDQLLNYTDMVLFKRANSSTLDTTFYRTFRSDEQGHYALTISPEYPLDKQYSYTLLAWQESMQNPVLFQFTNVLSGDVTVHDFIFQGEPPKIPRYIFGRTLGFLNRPFYFLTTSMDPDDSTIYYKFDWGDTTYSEWIGPYNSYHGVLTLHKWNIPGEYEVKVCVKDETGYLSLWSNSKKITIYPSIFD